MLVLASVTAALAGELIRGWGAIPYGPASVLRQLPDDSCRPHRTEGGRSCVEHIGSMAINVTYSVSGGRFDGVWVGSQGDSACADFFRHLKGVWGAGGQRRPTITGGGQTTSYWIWSEIDENSGTLATWTMTSRPVASESHCGMMTSHSIF